MKKLLSLILALNMILPGVSFAAIKQQRISFPNTTGITLFQTEGTISIISNEIVSLRDPVAGAWDILGWHNDLAVSASEGDFVFFKVKVDLAATSGGFMGVTKNSALSISTDSVYIYWINGALKSYNGASVLTLTLSPLSDTFYDIRFTINATNVDIDFKLSSVDDYTTGVTQTITLPGNDCHMTVNGNNNHGSVSRSYTMASYTWTDSAGIPAASSTKYNGQRLVRTGEM